MIDRKKLALEALYNAQKIRLKKNKSFDLPISIFDFVEQHDVEVKFIDTKSIEGIYSKNPKPVILVGAFRPRGRQVFNCAHEFGHHVFNHGTKVDEIIENRNSDTVEEFLADCFAGFLLMPIFAINKAMKDRGWDIKKLTPEQCFIISSFFGVGYKTFLYHICNSLKLISYSTLDKYLKIKRNQISESITKNKLDDDLIVVDQYWGTHPIDLQVGNYLLVPSNILFNANYLIPISNISNSTLYKAVSPGIGRFTSQEKEWAIFCRVSRKEYIGRNKFKHLEEVNDE